MTSIQKSTGRKQFGLIALATAALAAVMPITVHADSAHNGSRQNFQRDQQRHLREHQVLVHNQQISHKNDERSHLHDQMSRERSKRNFLLSQQKHHKH